MLCLQLILSFSDMHIRCCVVDCFVHWFNHRNGIIRVPFGGGILILSREYQGLERRGGGGLVGLKAI
jgi:hypothetical protein